MKMVPFFKDALFCSVLLAPKVVCKRCLLKKARYANGVSVIFHTTCLPVNEANAHVLTEAGWTTSASSGHDTTKEHMSRALHIQESLTPANLIRV